MKTKRFFCWACVLVAILIASNGFSQDAKAESILNKVSEKAKTYKSIQADFESKLEDKAIGLSASQNGNILLEGEKFKLNIDQKYLVISDGTTLWNYGMDTGECIIENVEEVIEEQGIQPSDIFRIWEKDFKKYYDSEVTVNDKACDVIKLVPANPKDKSYHSIKVYIERESNQVSQAVIFGKEGNNTTYTITSFKTDISTSNSDFAFNQADYPGVEMIDNR